LAKATELNYFPLVINREHLKERLPKHTRWF